MRHWPVTPSKRQREEPPRDGRETSANMKSTRLGDGSRGSDCLVVVASAIDAHRSSASSLSACSQNAGRARPKRRAVAQSVQRGGGLELEPQEARPHVAERIGAGTKLSGLGLGAYHDSVVGGERSSRKSCPDSLEAVVGRRQSHSSATAKATGPRRRLPALPFAR